MKLGGISRSDSAQAVLRWTTLGAPVFIALYIFLSTMGALTSPFGYATSESLALLFIVLWGVSGVSMFILFRSNLWNAALRLTLFHILGASFLVLFTGVAFPFTALWLLLIIASYGYFGFLGAAGSIVALFGVATLDSALHQGTFATNIAMAASVAILAAMTLALIHVQERDEDAFIQARNSEALQRESLLTLVNNLNDAVLSVDNNGIIRTFNAATISLFDTNANLTGAKIDTVIGINHAETHKRALLSKMLKKATTLRHTDEYYTVVGEEDLRLGITYAPIRSAAATSTAGKDGYIIILRDITKEKSLEEERDEFISVVSHELRTPITVTEGTISNVEVMLERGVTQPGKLREALHMAHEQILYLAKMVNDLGTLSRAERGVGDTQEEIDVQSILHDLYNEYAPQAAEKNLHLNLDIPGIVGSVFTSRLYLQELLQNFITNSIKYTQEGTITISCQLKKNSVVFSVHDTGIGISKHDQARIFDKFYRSEDYRTRESGGTGLGLHVATKLARKIHTKIGLESRLNHGSTFWFALPQYTETPSKP